MMLGSPILQAPYFLRMRSRGTCFWLASRTHPQPSRYVVNLEESLRRWRVFFRFQKPWNLIKIGHLAFIYMSLSPSLHKSYHRSIDVVSSLEGEEGHCSPWLPLFFLRGLSKVGEPAFLTFTCSGWELEL